MQKFSVKSSGIYRNHYGTSQGPGGELPFCHCGRTSLILGQLVWDFWWTKCHGDRFLSEYFGSSLSESVHHHSFICHRHYIIVATHSTVNTTFQRVNRPCGPKPPQYWNSEITIRHTIFGRTPLDDWSVVAETSTWPHTQRSKHRYPSRREDSNPQNQQASVHHQQLWNYTSKIITTKLKLI